MIFREIDRDDDNFSILLVSKSCRLNKMLIELESHLAHFLGENCAAQGDRSRRHGLPRMYFSGQHPTVKVGYFNSRLAFLW